MTYEPRPRWLPGFTLRVFFAEECLDPPPRDLGPTREDVGVDAVEDCDAVPDLQLTDLNLAQRVLTLAGVRRELDPFSLQVFTDWLTYRRNTWPLTANPHLLVNVCSALHGRPIGATSLNVLFRGTGISLDRIRMDRHLEEALSYGPDPLHLTAVFGISESTGVRYTTNARQLLRPPPPG